MAVIMILEILDVEGKTRKHRALIRNETARECRAKQILRDTEKQVICGRGDNWRQKENILAVNVEGNGERDP